MNQDRRRGMRGLILRVNAGYTPHLDMGRRLDYKRHSSQPLPEIFPKRKRQCPWCGEHGLQGRRRWHSHCVIWSAASKCSLTPWEAHQGRPIPWKYGSPEYQDYWKGYRAFLVCVQCGADSELEIEHELAISVASELGRRGVLRAYMPDNLRYLCSPCHKVKTRRDRLILKMLRDGLLPPDPPPPLPMFPGL